ncbi:MAG: DEAD/DEAH box helicase, partial [Candidatus Diapherotrites archaeon]|nr:DEAD/DEAH box helicase [Candidatus Diapherotrites archaeon]
MTEFIEHPLIKPETIEARTYQSVLAARVLENPSSLVVAPTALGKTIVAVMVAAHLLQKYPDKKILILAPTRPLCEQHKESFRKFLNIPEEKIITLTGTTEQKLRNNEWENASVICATPQTIENDIITERIDLSELEACIFDETHRAVKEYSYVFIGKQLNALKRKPLILALTASPGASKEKIEEICTNLGIENIEIKTLQDADVQEYIKPIDMEIRYVELPKETKEIAEHLRAFVKEKLEELKALHLVRTAEINQ